MDVSLEQATVCVIRELVEGHPTLAMIAAALSATRVTLRREFNALEKRLRAMARSDTRARLLMTTPGVGTIVSLVYVAAIDDSARFKSSKIVGAHRAAINRAKPTAPAASQGLGTPRCAVHVMRPPM